MSLSPPVVAAAVSGVISLIINITSIIIQYKLNERGRQKANREKWMREVQSLVRQLRRKALELDLSEENIEEIDAILDDLKHEMDKIPQRYKNTDVSSSLSEILVQQSHYTDNVTNMSLPTYRGNLIEKSESFLELVEEDR